VERASVRDPKEFDVDTLRTRIVFALVAIVVALTAAIPAPSAQDAVEEFTAFAINTNRRPTGGPAANRPTTATLTFRIERWSTAEEREQLAAILKEEPNVSRMNDAMLRTLQRLPRVGFIRESQTLGWDLRFAQQTPLPDGGRRLLIATDRPIGFWEAANRPRSIDYPFTILEIRLNKDNQGEGKMLADTRLIFNRTTNTLEMEFYDTAPVRLNQIRRRN
jgi:hypothetical protein